MMLAGFNLRKFVSNPQKLQEHISTQELHISPSIMMNASNLDTKDDKPYAKNTLGDKINVAD